MSDENNPTDAKSHSSDITIKRSTYNNMKKGLVAAIAIAAFVGGYALGNSPDTDSVTKEDISDILKGISAKPVQVAQQPTQPSTSQLTMISLDDDPVKGNPNAPVAVVEFSDFQCPFCSRFYQQTLSSLEENYVDTGKIKFVYRDLPLDNLHPNARPAAIAAECADEQGKFWEFHNILFEKQAEWQSLSSSEFASIVKQYATNLGLQADSFELCMQSQATADEVNKDSLEAARYGITGTPTFYIGNEKDGFVKLVGAQPYSAFVSAIDSQLD